MKLSSLTAISPIDGRYEKTVYELRTIFSEFGLLKFRVKIEIYWLKKLASCDKIKEIPPFNYYTDNYLNEIISNFSVKDAKLIKTIERSINHDVKAVEYFLKRKITAIPNLKIVSEFIHFACTSEDINNLSYALMLFTTRKEILLPIWQQIINSIKKLAFVYQDTPMLSRTHGQPATPSTIGKEMANFVYRLTRQYRQFKRIKILGKFNGTVGNHNAHIISYPEINWLEFSKEFVNSLGIYWNPYTTQIEPHDYIAELFNCIVLFNTILINFNRDIWGYIALNYFNQQIINKEIGSSIMPYKVNPINFENSEGNLGLANAMLNHIINKLPISRWQRDLSDSTVLRNLGVGIGYSLIAYQSLINGVKKLKVNQNYLLKELNQNWKILSEPIQIVMRRYGINNSYEKLKKFTRGKDIDANKIYNFIDNLPLPEIEKSKLKAITPANYIGYAAILANAIK